MNSISHPCTRLLDVRNLSVGFGRRGQQQTVVDRVSLHIQPGECLALVGESGSGKSVTARALLGLVGNRGTVSADRVDLDGHSLLGLSAGQWRHIRGRRIGLVLQDALVSLDPLRRIGLEIDDSLRLHTALSPVQRRERVLELLESVGMPEPRLRVEQRSGELSGGLRQRALIASAIALRPPLLIADEPTTALDVTVQAQILQLLAHLKQQGTAVLLISHDLAVVNRIADRVAVMRGGHIVEEGPTDAILNLPTHHYTRALIDAVPAGTPRGQLLVQERHNTPTAVPPPMPTKTGAPLLEAANLAKTFRRPDGSRFTAVDDVSFHVRSGQTLGLVGESGSGKTTVARLVLGLTQPDEGTVTLAGEAWSRQRERERRARRHLVGAIYQDPLSSFDPRHTVGQILRDAVGSGENGRSREAQVARLLDAVGLSSGIRDRRPLHLSGGQRQRVAIARAIAPSPALIICDEPVSALDVSVQAQVLDLLDELQKTLNIGYLFISHDLGVVQHMSDTVAVMQRGRIVETGPAEDVFRKPDHPYTRQLVAAAPRL
ncbi:MAG: transporter ATP-binding protein [Homoserinimonas sp.]|nr:transporter ATP-binding protein [Homoserinimonas sp.]